MTDETDYKRIEHLDMSTSDVSNENLDCLTALFPNYVTESVDGRVVDFDMLRQELSGAVVESGKERYHSDWLSMIYPRLKLARNLLTDDDVMFISVDDDEVHNLRKLCDEVFGEGNFVVQVIVQTLKTVWRWWYMPNYRKVFISLRPSPITVPTGRLCLIKIRCGIFISWQKPKVPIPTWTCGRLKS